MRIRIVCPRCMTPFFIDSETILTEDEEKMLFEKDHVRHPEWEP